MKTKVKIIKTTILEKEIDLPDYNNTEKNLSFAINRAGQEIRYGELNEKYKTVETSTTIIASSNECIKEQLYNQNLY